MSSGGFSTSANIVATDQATVLLAAVKKLRDSIPAFNDPAVGCIVSDKPWPSIEMNEPLFCTVCPASAGFDMEQPIGAGSLGVEEHSVIQVTVWSRITLDQAEHAEIAFTDADRGLLSLKKLVLKSLAGQQLFSDAPFNTQQLLTTCMRPSRAMHEPTRQDEGDYSSFSLAFDAPFYWDLS